MFPLTAALRQLLETPHAEHERLKKAGRIVPWVFWRMVARAVAVRSTRSRSSGLRRRGAPRAGRPAALAVFPTIFGVPASAIWSAPASPNASP